LWGSSIFAAHAHFGCMACTGLWGFTAAAGSLLQVLAIRYLEILVSQPGAKAAASNGLSNSLFSDNAASAATQPNLHLLLCCKVQLVARCVLHKLSTQYFSSGNATFPWPLEHSWTQFGPVKGRFFRHPARNGTWSRISA
jgi:hypothetical protein